MKKILRLFGAMALSTTTITSVITFLPKLEEKKDAPVNEEKKDAPVNEEKKENKIINFTNITKRIPSNVSIIKALTATSNGDIYIATENTLYKSTDNGDSFTNITGGINGKITCLEIASNGHIYVGTDKGLWKSTDNGANFTRIKQFDHCVFASLEIDKNGDIVGKIINYKEIKGTDFKSLVIDKNGTISNYQPTNYLRLTFAPNGDIYGINDETIFRSTDNGANFTPINNISEPSDPDSPKGELSGQIAYLEIDKNGHIYVLTTSNLYKSTDNGDSFTPVKLEIKGQFVKFITIANDNIYIITI